MRIAGKCRHCGVPVDEDTFVCEKCFAGFQEPYHFPDNDAARSSSSVMQAGVCQQCGCKLDGFVRGGQVGCKCKCHSGA